MKTPLYVLKETEPMEHANKPVIVPERGKRVRELREFRDLSQDQLADLIGVSQGAIQKIETGGNSKYFIKIADILNCEINWLVEGAGQSPFVPPPPKTSVYTRPVLSWSDVIQWQTWAETVRDNIKERVPMDENYRNCFIMCVKDDLMVASNLDDVSFKPGEKIVVDPDLPPENGQYVIVHEKDDSEAMLRKYTVVGSKRYLSAHKLKHAEEMKETTKIHGVVVEKIAREVLVAR